MQYVQLGTFSKVRAVQSRLYHGNICSALADYVKYSFCFFSVVFLMYALMLITAVMLNNSLRNAKLVT